MPMSCLFLQRTCNCYRLNPNISMVWVGLTFFDPEVIQVQPAVKARWQLAAFCLDDAHIYGTVMNQFLRVNIPTERNFSAVLLGGTSWSCLFSWWSSLVCVLGGVGGPPLGVLAVPLGGASLVVFCGGPPWWCPSLVLMVVVLGGSVPWRSFLQGVGGPPWWRSSLVVLLPWCC